MLAFLIQSYYQIWLLLMCGCISWVFIFIALTFSFNLSDLRLYFFLNFFSQVQKHLFADVFQNSCCEKFRKHLCWSVSLIKLQAPSFIKKRLQHRRFPVNNVKFSRTAFLQNTSGSCFCRYVLTQDVCKSLMKISRYFV